MSDSIVSFLGEGDRYRTPVQTPSAIPILCGNLPCSLDLVYTRVARVARFCYPHSPYETPLPQSSVRYTTFTGSAVPDSAREDSK